MNITQAVPLMLRAARADAKKARRQWPLGLAACIGAAVICLVGLGVI